MNDDTTTQIDKETAQQFMDQLFQDTPGERQRRLDSPCPYHMKSQEEQDDIFFKGPWGTVLNILIVIPVMLLAAFSAIAGLAGPMLIVGSLLGIGFLIVWAWSWIKDAAGAFMEYNKSKKG
jgi:hypothetical protein